MLRKKQLAEQIAAVKAREAAMAEIHEEPEIVPIDPLGQARQFYEYADYKAFYKELNRAVWSEISAKLNLPSSELNKYNIGMQLRFRGMAESDILSLNLILNECEMKLYTPDYDESDIQRILQSAGAFIEKLNRV